MSLSLLCLTLTTITDPGIIPRGKKNQSVSATEAIEKSRQGEEKLLTNAVNEESKDEEAGPVLKRLSELDHYALVKNQEISVHVCRTCHIVKPPRSFHCSNCEACIEVHDHHCPWVGTCVGKRNHKYFLLFAITATLHSTFTLALDLVYLIGKMYQSDDPNKE